MHDDIVHALDEENLNIETSGIKTSNKIAMRSCFAYWTGKCLQRHIGWQECRKSGHHIHMEMQSGTDFLLGKVVSF